MFQKRFSPLIKSGAKRQTIRPIPKRMPKVGDKESWREWTGEPYRSKQRELAQVEITVLMTVVIYDNGVLFSGKYFIPDYQLGYLAKEDGFESFQSLVTWFRIVHDLPFRGILIKAKDA